MEALKTNLLLILKFLKEAPEQQGNTIKCLVIRQNQERREMLLKLKKKIRSEGDTRLPIEIGKSYSKSICLIVLSSHLVVFY